MREDRESLLGFRFTWWESIGITVMAVLVLPWVLLGRAAVWLAHRMRERWVGMPQGIQWLAIGIAAIATAWVLFVPAADWLAHHDVGSATGTVLQAARDAARGRLLTFGAGVFAAGALLFTARNFTLSREGQVTDRYTKAIEQLGSGKVDVRIGGIYALERIARDSAKDYPTVMAVLTTFVREHSRKHREKHKKHEQQWLDEPWSREKEQERFTRPDIQAALTVIGRRDPSRDKQPIDLVGAFLDSANLSGANLAGADLVFADLVAASLDVAILAEANLTGTDLTGAILDGADLTRAELQDAKMVNAGRLLTGAMLDDLTRAAGGGEAKIVQVRLPLGGSINFTGANLQGADLSRANLRDSDFTGATLQRTDFSEANVRNANFEHAFLVSANFTGADLTSANLSRSALPHLANFKDANLFGALWPADAQVPVGWERDANNGALRRAETTGPTPES
jgi:uncharacterized protein YjbI with pentapeptide repeats